MKIGCACGALIHDGGDGLPGKAHIIPDVSLFPLMDAFDDVLLQHCSTATEREAACTHLRQLLIKATRPAWQCAACGRLYIDDADRKTNVFAPEGTSFRLVFVGRREAGDR